MGIYRRNKRKSKQSKKKMRGGRSLKRLIKGKIRRTRKRKNQKRSYKKKTMRGGCGCANNMTGGRRKRKSRRRRNMRKSYKKRSLRGGASHWDCNAPSNMGELYTGVKNNTNPMLPDPKSLNSNLRVHQLTKQTGGGIPELLYDFGLGDLTLNYWKGTNAAQNIKHRYNGSKAEVGADPMNQPHLLKDLPMPYETANIPDMYESASTQAAKHTVSN